LYGVGSAARQLASVIMLPIYTRHLSPGDYGAVEIASLLVACAALIAGLSLGEGIFRYYHSERGPRVISTALLVGLLSNGLAALLIWIAAPTLGATFLGPGYSHQLIALLSLTLVADCCSSVAACQMRAEGQALRYFALGMLRLALNVGLNTYFLVALDLGPMGVVYGGLLAASVTAAVALAYTLSRVGMRWSRDAAVALVSFGIPLAFANIATFYLTAADRFFIESFVSLAEVGVYALAARLAQGYLLICYEPFGQLWDAEKYRLWERSRNSAPFQSVFRLLTTSLLAGGACLSICAPEIIRLLATERFERAAAIAPILIAAAALTALSMFCRLGSLVTDRTGNVNRAAWLAAVALTGLALLLVPRWGTNGAAGAVLGAAAVRLFAEHWLATRAHDLQFPWGTLAPVALAVVAFTICVLAFSPAGAPGLLVKFAACAVLTAALWWSPLMSTTEREFALRVIGSR
jgi:O-antigen/teichoic acid export membrane protein